MDQVITIITTFGIDVVGAIAILSEGGYLTAEEIPAARKVLNAAAWTYVASALMAVLSLLRLLIMSGLLGGRDD